MKNSISIQRRLIPDELRVQSLNQMVTKWTLGAAMLGLLMYAVIEYLVAKPENLSGFIGHHLLDVSLVILAVWFTCSLLIRRLVIEPTTRVFVHLRRMAAGRIEYLEGEMKSREIAEVAASINQLVAKLSGSRDERSVAEGLDSLKQLRTDLTSAAGELGERTVPIMRSLAKLEANLLHLLPEVPDEAPTCCRHGGSDCKPS